MKKEVAETLISILNSSGYVASLLTQFDNDYTIYGVTTNASMDHVIVCVINYADRFVNDKDPKNIQNAFKMKNLLTGYIGCQLVMF